MAKALKCAYNHCLHPDLPLILEGSVDVGGKRYHWDCSATKFQILDIVNKYMSYKDDPSLRPQAIRAINSLVFSSNVPLEFIQKRVDTNKRYYSDRPVNALYGLKRLYWEFTVGR